MSTTFTATSRNAATFTATAKSVVAGSLLLKEDGGKLLLEDGGGIVLEQSVNTGTVFTTETKS